MDIAKQVPFSLVEFTQHLSTTLPSGWKVGIHSNTNAFVDTAINNVVVHFDITFNGDIISFIPSVDGMTIHHDSGEPVQFDFSLEMQELDVVNSTLVEFKNKSYAFMDLYDSENDIIIPMEFYVSNLTVGK